MANLSRNLVRPSLSDNLDIKRFSETYIINRLRKIEDKNVLFITI